MLQDMNGMAGHHASIHERVAELERFVGDSADKHNAELEALKRNHSKHAKDMEALKGFTPHASLEERVAELERFTGDSADKHFAEIETLKKAHAKHAKEFDNLRAVGV